MAFHDLFDLDDIFKKRNKRGLGDFHLRSALLLVEWDKLVLGKGKKRELIATRTITNVISPSSVVPSYPVELFTLLLFEDVNATNLPLQKEVYEILGQEAQALKRLISPGDLFLNALGHLRDENFIFPELTIKRKLTIGLMCLMAKTSEREFVESDEIKRSSDYNCDMLIIGKVFIYLFGELVCYRYFGEEELKVISLDGYRMIVDKFTERSNVLVATQLGHKILPEIYPPEERIKRLFTMFDLYLLHQKNDGYKLLKAFEALITGIILKRRPSVFWRCDEFWNNTVSEMNELDLSVCSDLERLCNEEGTTIHHLTQYMGLFRLWGHPVVNAEKGVEKVRSIGKDEKIISSYLSEVAGWKFLEIFFRSHFSKNGYYPEFSLIPNFRACYLIDCLSNEVIINLKDPAYDIIQWKSIIVSKNFDVPASFNLSMIVADTAISPTRKEIFENSKTGVSNLDPTVRRGVLKWMRDGVLDCKSLLTMINENPEGLPKEHRIIGLYQKERELNPVARMFALMSLMMRAYVVVTESMLSDHILQYIPGITMTYSMVELTKEMIKSTWRQKEDDPHSVTFCINMDFEKWNLNMRKQSTFHVFQNLGRLFGLEEIFNRTYDIFENSIIYLADGSYDLILDEDLELLETNPNLAYINHQGGFEGLRQKGWTIFTVVLIQYCCNKLGVDWKLMGQGDNQVLLVTIYSRFSRTEGIYGDKSVFEIRRKLRDLLNLLIETFAEVGLPLKPLETWVSDTFFSYGKFPIYRGLPCSMSLKKISRIFFFSNEDIMTLDNAMGSIVSNAQSAAMSDVIPIIPYFIAKWQQMLCVQLFLFYHPLLGKRPIGNDGPNFTMMKKDGSIYRYSVSCEYRTDIVIKILCSFPKTLGGLNCVTYFQMIMRGFSDPVNMDYQWLWEMSQVSPRETSDFFRNIKNLMLNDERNFCYLLQDPVGINLFVPTNSSQAIKEMIHRVIHSLPFDSQFSNWFKEVMSISDPEMVEKLVEQLTDQDRLNIRFLHDILGSTIFGYCDSITSKVDKTVTLSRIALSQEDVVGKVMKSEERYMNYLLWRMYQPGNFENKVSCPSLYIRDCRFVGWGKILEGVSVPFPYEYLTEDVTMTDRPDSFLIGVIDDKALCSNEYTLTNVGKALPYLGSVTQEKLPVSSTRLAYGTEPLINRPIRLLRSLGWFVEKDSNFNSLLEDLVKAVTDLNIEDLTLIPEKVKGSMIHRYSDFATKHGSLWLPLFGPATFINLSTNNLLEFSKGSKNVTLHFQAMLCYFQFLIISKMLGSRKAKVVKLWKSCKDCIIPINDEFIDLKEPISSELIPTRPENPYLFLRKEDINIEQKRVEEKMRTIKRVTLQELSDDQIMQSLADWMGIRIGCSIAFNQSEDQTHDLLDISGVSRTVFLKLHPYMLLKSIVKSLYVIISMSPKYADKFPHLDYVKGDIIRTVSRSDPKNFSLYSGYYLWPESQKILRRFGASFPDSYPATAHSASVAAKRTILSYLRGYTRLEFYGPNVIFFGYESQFVYHLKLASLRRLFQPNSCRHCLQKVLTSKYILRSVLDPVDLGKCQAGHNFVSLSDLETMAYLPDVNIDSIVDKLPVLGDPEIGVGRVLQLKIHFDENKRQITRILLSSSDLKMDGGPREKVFISCFEKDSAFEGFVDQHFSFPTRGFYRMAEILSSHKEARDGNLLVLGDGFGGSSLMASAINQRGYRIISWTYTESSQGISHSLQDSKPPTLYPFENDIYTSISFEEIGDIGNPKFEEGFKRVIRNFNIDRIISDIEWWYVGDDHSIKLIRACQGIKVRYLALRVFTSDLDNTFQIIEEGCRCYEIWEIIETKNINRLQRELLFVLRNPRKTRYNSVFLSIEDLITIRNMIYSYDFLNCNELILNRTKFIEQIDRQLISDSHYMSWIEDICNNWYTEAEMIGWKSKNFTQLFHCLRTGRRPREISDMTGSDIYYMRETWKEKVLSRLLTLALSMVSNYSEVAMALRDDWAIVWEIGKESRYYRGNLIHNIELIRRGTRKNRISAEMKNVLRFVGLVRAIRRCEGLPIEFSKIGDKITFFYHPRHRPRPEEVFFLISKNANYATLESF